MRQAYKISCHYLFLLNLTLRLHAYRGIQNFQIACLSRFFQNFFRGDHRSHAHYKPNKFPMSQGQPSCSLYISKNNIRHPFAIPYQKLARSLLITHNPIQRGKDWPWLSRTVPPPSLLQSPSQKIQGCPKCQLFYFSIFSKNYFARTFGEDHLAHAHYKPKAVPRSQGQPSWSP